MSVYSRRVYNISGFWIFKRDSVHSIVRTANFGVNRFRFISVKCKACFLADRFGVFCNRPRGQRSIETGKLLGHQLQIVPEIDGQLSGRKDFAFADGVWDIYRLCHMLWYDDGRRNRLADRSNEFQTRYDAVWDSEYLYFGTWVRDNVKIRGPKELEQSIVFAGI